MKLTPTLVCVLSVAAAIAATSPAMASTYLSCDGCGAAQMRQTALRQGFGRYLVGSVTDQKLRAFRVMPEAGAGSALQASDGEIYPPEREGFAALVRFYNAGPVGYHKHFTVQFPGAGDTSAAAAGKAGPLGPTMNFADTKTNAYDVVDGGPRQNAFLQSIKNSGAFKTYGKPPFVEIFPSALTVAFADGSRIRVYIDTGTLPHQLSVRPNSAHDSHSNTLPSSWLAIAGEGTTQYSFAGAGNPSDVQQMRHRLESFRIEVPAGNSYVCSRFPSPPAGETTRCRSNRGPHS